MLTYLPLGCDADELKTFAGGPYPASALNSNDPAAVACQSANPAPSGTMKYLLASAIGCALDVDLSTGKNKHTGGAATDDAPLINAAMSTASVSNPLTLLLDGTALISGLRLPAGGYWSIEGIGCGSGFFIKSGSNCDGIHNGGPNAGLPIDPGAGVPLPARGSSVTLSNFTLNGNQGNGQNGDSSRGPTQGDPWCFGINLMNLNNITLTNVTVLNAPAYHVRLSNVGNVTATGCVMKSSGPNTDGLHFDGPANDITIKNCDFTCGDDAVALNCPEGYGGDITRVTVSDCTFNSLSLARLDTGYPGSPTYAITSVSFTNCNGSMTSAAFLLGTYAKNDTNAVLAFTCSNCQVSAPTVLDITGDFSNVSLSDVVLTVPPTGGGAFVRSYNGLQRTYAGGILSLQNCALKRQSNDYVPLIYVQNNSHIGTLEVNGFSIQDPVGSSYQPNPELVAPEPGSIGNLVLDAVDARNILAPVTPGDFGSVGSVSGAGVLATGWFFPDAVMANGVPYLSAATGRGAVKVNGVAQAYP